MAAEWGLEHHKKKGMRAGQLAGRRMQLQLRTCRTGCCNISSAKLAAVLWGPMVLQWAPRVPLAPVQVYILLVNKMQFML